MVDDIGLLLKHLETNHLNGYSSIVKSKYRTKNVGSREKSEK